MASQRLELNFPIEQVKEPVIWRIGHDFKVVTNIRRANVTPEGGWVVLEVTGSDAEIEKAIAYMRRLGITVTPIERDVVE